MEQLVARQAHNLEVVRSSRASATTRSQTDTATSVRLLFSYPSPSSDSPSLRRQQPPAKQQSTTRKRRGATCDARITDAKQHSTARKRRGATRDARMTDAKQHSTTRKRRGATCDARITDEIPRIGRRKTANARRETTFNQRPARIRRRATRPTTCAVPAPGVINGAPTGYAANRPPQNNNQPSPRPHPPTRNATDHMCRSGTGRHEWRPHERRHKTTTAKQRSTATNVGAPLVTPG